MASGNHFSVVHGAVWGGGAFARAHVLSLFQLQVNAVLEIIKVN